MHIEDIAGTVNPALRNLRITQTYHDLGSRLAGRGLVGDATWLFFAVWASKTAGGIIRGEELPACLREQLAANQAALTVRRERINRKWRFLRWLHLPARLEHDHLVRVAEQVAEMVSAEIAEGNLIVFQELAPLFTELVDADAEADATTARPDPTPPAAPTAPPPPLLDQAMDAYRQALTEADAGRRTLHILRANAAAVAHEQQRLQDKIQAALDAPIADGLKDLIDTEVARWLPGRVMRAAARRAVGDLCTEVEGIWRTAVTLTMMRLVTADEHLDLHDTVPALPGQPLFLGPLASPDATLAVAEWDLTAGRGHPCGATDWAVISQRMNYIVNFFRSRQQHPGLTRPPFSETQIAAIEAGQMPAGPL